LKENSERSKPLTMRQAMEEHRQNAVCAGCHKIMDPLGFAMGRTSTRWGRGY
jgi:hypothetical protein